MKPKELCRYTNLPTLAAADYVKKYALSNEVEMILNVKESDIFKGLVEFNYTVIVYERLKRPSEME